MFNRYFTPAEANKRLPLVQNIVTDILKKGKQFRSSLPEKPAGEFPRDIENIKNEIEALVRELEDLGCIYKDWNFEVGLVDFPSMIDGNPVLLCWRSDEQDVKWYHSVDEGYIGRKLIPQELLV